VENGEIKFARAKAPVLCNKRNNAVFDLAVITGMQILRKRTSGTNLLVFGSFE